MRVTVEMSDSERSVIRALQVQAMPPEVLSVSAAVRWLISDWGRKNVRPPIAPVATDDEGEL